MNVLLSIQIFCETAVERNFFLSSFFMNKFILFNTNKSRLLRSRSGNKMTSNDPKMKALEYIEKKSIKTLFEVVYKFIQNCN